MYELHIKTSSERLWPAITDPAIRTYFSFGTTFRGDGSVGSTVEKLPTPGSLMYR